jgi:hypothetical protein
MANPVNPTWSTRPIWSSQFGQPDQVGGNGQRYLIAKALGQESTMSDLDGDDIDMMMSLSHFVTTLTWN